MYALGQLFPSHHQSSSKHFSLLLKKLAFLDTLLKWKNGKISALAYRKPGNTDQYLHYSSHYQTSCKEGVVSSFFNRAYFIITNEDDLNGENARIKQVLKENGYQEAFFEKALID